jgi:hypothetical protein
VITPSARRRSFEGGAQRDAAALHWLAELRARGTLLYGSLNPNQNPVSGDPR